MDKEKILGRQCKISGMSHIYIIDSLWYSCPLYKTLYNNIGYYENYLTAVVGIVKTWDSITKEYKTYIGLGDGDNLELDEDRIAGCGASFTNPVSFDDMKTWLKMKEK